MYTGDLVPALAEAAEALRHSGAALHSTQTSADQALGELAPNKPSLHTPPCPCGCPRSRDALEGGRLTHQLSWRAENPDKAMQEQQSGGTTRCALLQAAPVQEHGR